MAQSSTATPSFSIVDELTIEVDRSTIYELGWQSWSPSGIYNAAGLSPRPQRELWQTMAFRPERPLAATGFQSEGMLGVDPGNGAPMTIYAMAGPTPTIPTIRAALQGSQLTITSTDPIEVTTWPSAANLEEAVAGWTEQFATRCIQRPLRTLSPTWCSWYCYWFNVTAEDVLRASRHLYEREIPADVIQIDDGWQRSIGDWQDSERFGSLEKVVKELQDQGRSVGIWLAPFLVGHKSQLFKDHPDWLVPDRSAGFNWNQELSILDTTRPEALNSMTSTLSSLRDLGIQYFKLDFLYAGAIAGTRHRSIHENDAYREALGAFRSAIGEDSIVVGCGAPLIPSIGLVDAMRISPDVSPTWEPPLADISQPGGRASVLGTRARRALQGRWWTNDPDCLLLRPEIEHRDLIAASVEAAHGLNCLSDPPDKLDAWGVEAAQRLMTNSSTSPAVPAPPVTMA
ncbi:MAG: alpha-galactosidase [Acidimicrobiales bacterium]